MSLSNPIKAQEMERFPKINVSLTFIMKMAKVKWSSSQNTAVFSILPCVVVVFPLLSSHCCRSAQESIVWCRNWYGATEVENRKWDLWSKDPPDCGSKVASTLLCILDTAWYFLISIFPHLIWGSKDFKGHPIPLENKQGAETLDSDANMPPLSFADIYNIK